MEDDTGKKSLLKRWKESEKKKSLALGIPKAPPDTEIPASHGQQRLWFLQQLYPGNQVYNYSELYTFKGRLQPEVLKQSIQNIFATNTILRASFELENGALLQKTDTVTEIAITDHDLSHLPVTEREQRKMKILMADAAAAFDLDRPPLMRVSLLRTEVSEWILLVTMHHIITDKWSMGIFREQVALNYRNLSSAVPIKGGAPEIQFSDYAWWQQNRELEAAQLDYWKEKLSGEIPSLNLPTDHAFTGNNTFKGATHHQRFSKPLSRKLLNLSMEMGTTPYVLLLSVYYIMLHRYSGQRDILIGTPISIRKGKIQEGLIGFFDETVVLRTSLPAGITFPELVEKVKKTTLEAFSNKDIPFDILVKELKPERALGKNPFFRTMFMYHDVPETPSFGPGVELTYTFLNSGVSKFDLTMYISNDNDLLSSSFEYSKDLFNEDTILMFQEHYKLLLESIVKQAESKISDISMLTAKERELFFPKDVPDKSPFENYSGIHQIIQSVGSENPDKLAVVFGKDGITYSQLIYEADRLAHNILFHTQGRNVIVGLCLERSVDMIVGMLAILKAGCAYLPIDPDYPMERIHFMLADSAVPLVLTQEKMAPFFNSYDGKVFLINSPPPADAHPALSLSEARREDLAYVIYTSGSTGKPKGVPISHQNIINSTQGRLNFYPDHPKVFLLMSSISFDSSKAGIFWTLCTGGTLVISKKRLEQDIEKIGEMIHRNSVSHTLMLPSLYATILDYIDVSKLQSLKTVIVAGEACTSAVCSSHFEKLPQTALYNEYGPTEATVWCIAHHIQKEDEFRSAAPIGKPVANAEIYILDNDLQPVPLRSTGEIYVGGPGLSEGYLNHPVLTAASFIAHPFKGNTGEKLYKTGDLGRYTSDGTIEFLGRADQQLKIRGFRIEPGEIEKILDEYPQIEKTVVLVEDTVRGNGHLNQGATELATIEEYLKKVQDGQQIENILSSIQSLNENEREYLLQQIQ